MIITDSHCHLDMLQDHDDIDNIVMRANEAGVKYLQTICTTKDNFANILSIAKKYDNVFASVGVHPNEVTEDIVDAVWLIDATKDNKVIGIGETGLDYYYDDQKLKHSLQQESFLHHIEAAQESHCPLIIHTRSAEPDTAKMLIENKKEKDFKGLIHCFTGSEEFAYKMLDIDFYISISGIITFKNAENLREIVKKIPLEKLLIETDSPYLAPVPYRGKTNEPAYVTNVLRSLSEIKNISIEKVAETTTNNFLTLFDIN